MNIIENFLSNFNKPNTIRNYKRALNDYFQVLDIKNPDNYFKSNRDYKADVKKFCQSMTNMAPKTFIVKIAAIKSFFDENEVMFPKKVVKNFRIRNDMRHIAPITKDKVFSRALLKNMLMQGGIREKSLFLTLASSGMRINEALQLKETDIDLEHDPPIINIKKEYTKNKEARITFVSYEARDHLREWLKIKNDYLKKYSHCIQNINKDLRKPKTDDRIFPYTATGGAWKMLQKIMTNTKAANKVEGLNRYEFHLHSFRKFFRTNLAVEMPVDMVESLMGHSGYLTREYRRYQDNPSLMFELYKKAMHMVSIFEGELDLSGVQNQLDEKDKQIKELQEKMGKMEYLMDQKAHLLKLLEIQVEQEKIKNKLNSK